jgi:hypothetical protein
VTSGGGTNSGASTLNFTFTGSTTGVLSIVASHDPYPVVVDNGENANPRTNLYYFDPVTNYLTVIGPRWTNSCYSEGSVSLSNITFNPQSKIVCSGSEITAYTVALVNTGWVQYADANNCFSSYTTNNNVPVGLTNWWTVAGPGSFSTNGGGLDATFTPTSFGQGTVTFYYTYSNPPPCTNIISVTNPITKSDSFTVVGITNLFASATNLCGPGSITFSGETDPNGYGSLVTWSGDGIDGNPSGGYIIVNYTNIGMSPSRIRLQPRIPLT